jgi:hypothetical protein
VEGAVGTTLGLSVQVHPLPADSRACGDRVEGAGTRPPLARLGWGPDRPGHVTKPTRSRDQYTLLHRLESGAWPEFRSKLERRIKHMQ